MTVRGRVLGRVLPDAPDLDQVAHFDSSLDQGRRSLDDDGNVLAVVAQCDEPLTYTNKAGKEVTKRVMHLADKSGKSIEATVFGATTRIRGDAQ